MNIMGKINKWAILVWFVFCTAMMLAMLTAYPQGTLQKFLNCGEIHTMTDSQYMQNYQTGIEKDPDRECNVIVEKYAIDTFSDYYLLYTNWNYLYLKADKLGLDTIKCKIIFNLYGQPVEEKEAVLSNGENIIKINHLTTDSFTLVFENCNQKTYRITDISFRTKEKNISEKEFFKNFCLYCVMVCILLFMIYTSQKKYITILWQKAYECWKQFCKGMAECYEIFWSQYVPRCRIGSLSRHRLRIAIFTAIFFIQYEANRYSINKYYTLMVFLILVGMFLITWLSSQEKKEEIVSENGNEWILLAMFLLFGILDFIIPKQYRFTGWWLLLAFAPFYYTFSRMKEKQLLFGEIRCSVHICYTATLLYCFFTYVPVEGIRYAGSWRNPNPFGIALAFYQIAVLSHILSCIKKKKYIAMILFITEYMAGIYFLYKSMCRTAFISMLGTWVILAVLCTTTIQKKYKRNLLTGIFLVMLCFAGIGFIWAMGNQRGTIVTNINSVSSGRIDIWRNYLLNLNLFGHTKRELYKYGREYAHNAIIWIMHHYGIYTGIFYILFWLNMVVQNILRYLKKYDTIENTLFMIGTSISFFIGASLDVAEEIPMAWPVWIGFYLCAAILFFQNPAQAHPHAD